MRRHKLSNSAKTAVNDRSKGGFAICTTGSAETVINEQSFRLTPGCALIATPLVQIMRFRPSDDYGEISFIDDLKLFYPVFRIIADTPVPLSVKENPCWRISDAVIGHADDMNKRIKELQRRIAECESTEKRLLFANQITLIRQQMMMEVVCDHLDNFPVDSRPTDRREAAAYRFLLSLHENFHIERRVSAYAAESGLSVGHFSTVIKDATGKTPSQWIAEITVTYSKLLLEQGDKSIKEIARELNFPEQFTFRKYFKHHAGLSPKEYKLSHIAKS